MHGGFKAVAEFAKMADISIEQARITRDKLYPRTISSSDALSGRI
jgi:hypothetical protein